jgi:hypothetical protein
VEVGITLDQIPLLVVLEVVLDIAAVLVEQRLQIKGLLVEALLVELLALTIHVLAVVVRAALEEMRPHLLVELAVLE